MVRGSVLVLGLILFIFLESALAAEEAAGTRYVLITRGEVPDLQRDADLELELVFGTTFDGVLKWERRGQKDGQALILDGSLSKARGDGTNSIFRLPDGSYVPSLQLAVDSHQGVNGVQDWLELPEATKVIAFGNLLSDRQGTLAVQRMHPYHQLYCKSVCSYLEDLTRKSRYTSSRVSGGPYPNVYHALFNGLMPACRAIAGHPAVTVDFNMKCRLVR